MAGILVDESEEEGESLVDRSVAFLKDLGARVREGATRKWRTTNLSLDIGVLRRRRRGWVLALGQATYGMLRRGSLDGDQLREYAEAIQELETQIAEREDRVRDLEQDDLFEIAEQDLVLEPMPRRRRAPRRRRRLPAEAAAGSEASAEEPWTEEGGEEEPLEPPPGVG